MASEDNTTTDTKVKELTPEERQQKAVLLGVTLQGLDALERKVSSGTLPTQPAPVAPPPMTGTQPPPVAPQGRMYMGPASGPDLDRFSAGQGPSNVNLMPPPAPMPPQAQAAMQGRMATATGGESDPAALSRLQAADRPGSSTIGVRSEPPYSDASMVNHQNAMRYEAMRKFEAGDRSPETIAAAMGSTGRTLQPKTHFGANGQVLQEQNGKIVEVRPPNAQKIAATKPNALLEKTILQLQKDISSDRRDLAKKPLVAGVPDERPAMLHKKQQDLAAMTAQYNQSFKTSPTGTAPPPVQAPTPQGRPVKDKSGKTWIYTGDAKNPKTDIEKSHWVEQ